MSSIVRRLQHAGRQRVAGLAAVLALSATLLIPSSVAAAPAAHYQLNGDTLTVDVVGGPRAGIWRVRIVAPDRRQRTDIVLRSGDVRWSAAVRTSRRTTSGWILVSRQRIAGTYDGLRAASGQGAGIRWSTAGFRLPRNGDGRFTVQVELLRDGRYRAVGSVRLAVEAFTYGRWARKTSGFVIH